MDRTLKLACLSREELFRRNSTCRRFEPFAVSWMDSEWRISLEPMQQRHDDCFFIEADWGGTKAVLCADAVWVNSVATMVLHGDEVAALPKPVMLAILQAAFSEIASQIELVTKKRFQVTKAGRVKPDLTNMHRMAWHASTNDRDSYGELWFDQLGFTFLGAVLNGAMYQPLDAAMWRHLPVPARLSVGWVDLPLHEFAAMARRDVILLDECWLQNGDELMVMVSGNSGFGVTLNGTTCTVTEGLKTIMANSSEMVAGDGLADIPIRLTFDLGERIISLGELQTLSPGYVFDLGRDPRHAVTIRANGTPVGEGELVEIEGRIGVSILALKPPAQKEIPPPYSEAPAPFQAIEEVDVPAPEITMENV